VCHNIKHHAVLFKITFAVPLTTLIAIILLFLGSHDTVSASAMAPHSEIDLSAQFGSGTPEGVWSDGSTIWVVDNESRRLVAYNRSTGNYLVDKTIELDGSNGAPRDIWSTASTIWVSDWDDTKLYAYGLGTGNRQANLLVHLHAKHP